MITLALAALTACGSTGVVPIGQEIFMISKTSAACGFRSADGTTAKLYREAGAYCAARKKELLTVSVRGRDGVPFARCASAELEFRCLVPGDSELAQPANADQNHGATSRK